MFGENIYIDFHTHKIDDHYSTDLISIQVFELENIVPSSYYTIGRHPWNVTKVLAQSELDLFRSHGMDENCLAIGEIGLDKLHSDTFSIQRDVYIQQLQSAAELGLPVIVHCVRAFDEVIQIKKKFPMIGKWAIHGFNKNAQLADQLIKEGFYLSLNTLKGTNNEEILNVLPINRLFLETDDSENSITDVYFRTAEIINISPSELKAQISKNANEFFRK